MTNCQAAGGNRTHVILLTEEVPGHWTTAAKNIGPAGIEPATSPVSGERSYH